MGTKYYRTKSSLCIFMFLATLDTIRQNYVQGLPTSDKNNYGQKPKGTIKTIEALEVGDIIDCVDIYKQPAFDNPIIKNLKNKIAHITYHSLFNKTTAPQPKLIQTWNRYGECPKGTIPIKRTWNTNRIGHRKFPNNPVTHEYAVVSKRLNKGKGGHAQFNVWKPLVPTNGVFSLSQMWVASGNGADLNTVEAGWQVYPRRYHDAEARLFIYWTRDNYNSTGCYNLVCEDFVQLDRNPQIAIGAAIETTSVYDGRQESIFIGFKMNRFGDWQLQVGDHLLGFYPRQLFSSLGDGADRIDFGGEIVNLQLNQRQTNTAMGSGKFSSEGYMRACFIKEIKVRNNKRDWVVPHFGSVVTTKPKCYDLTVGPLGTPLGSHFYFGGPGRLSHDQCV